MVMSQRQHERPGSFLPGLSRQLLKVTMDLPNNLSQNSRMIGDNYRVTFSKYQEKGVIWFDHMTQQIVVHDQDDLYEALFVLNSSSNADEEFLTNLGVKWP